MDLRNCLGMMASVSTFSRSIGATRPLCTVNFCIYFFAAFSIFSPTFWTSCPTPRKVLQPDSSRVTHASERASRVVIFLMKFLVWLGLDKLADIDKVTVHGRRRRHGGADQMGAPAGALAAFEV